MFTAINPQTREVITALVYQGLNEDTRPTELTCPGHAPGGTPCDAIVYPCALTSTKMGPYFRVERLDDHIDDCSEITGEFTPISTDDPYLVGVLGQQGPTGPKRVISVILKRPHDAPTTLQAPGDTPHHAAKRLGHHRAPAIRSHNALARTRAGLRKIANDHAAGIYHDDDVVRLTKDSNGQGIVSMRIFSAKRLIKASNMTWPIITYGRMATITQGNSPGRFFIRLALPNGQPTKVSILVRREQIDTIRQNIDFDAVVANPTHWQVVALGSIKRGSTGARYLVPHDAYSVEFEVAPHVDASRT